jgi:hypothetical protein
MRISGDDDGGATIDGIVVDTVAVAVTGVVPSVDVTVAGTTVHVAADGAPVQPRVTAWLKPPAGVTVTVKVPLAPCATVNVVGAPLRLKLAEAVPVPLNITVWGLVEAASVRTRLAVSAAATDGLKTTLTVHDALAAMLVPHVVVEVKSVLAAAGEPPETVALVNAIAELELLVSVTIFAADAVLIVCDPKAKLMGLTVKALPLLVPVPDKATVWGLVEAVSVRTRLAVSAAATDGLKTTPTVHEVLAAMLAPHVVVDVKSVFAATGEPPETVALVNAIAELELLVSVIIFAAEAVPTGCDPKARLVGVTVNAVVVPVPDRATVCGLVESASVMTRLAVSAGAPDGV